MRKQALLSAAILGSASFAAAIAAAPYKQVNALPSTGVVRIAAAQGKEVEGSKADVREDKAEVKAMAHHKAKHRRHRKGASASL